MNVCRQTFDFFPFVANIDCEKFIQEQRCTTNHSSRDPGEIRGKSKVSSILCPIPKRKGTRELNEFVAVRISSSDTTRLTEEKALRKERGGGSVRRQGRGGWNSGSRYILHNCWTTYRFYAAPVRTVSFSPPLP